MAKRGTIQMPWLEKEVAPTQKDEKKRKFGNICNLAGSIERIIPKMIDPMTHFLCFDELKNPSKTQRHWFQGSSKPPLEKTDDHITPSSFTSASRGRSPSPNITNSNLGNFNQYLKSTELASHETKNPLSYLKSIYQSKQNSIGFVRNTSRRQRNIYNGSPVVYLQSCQTYHQSCLNNGSATRLSDLVLMEQSSILYNDIST